ncbi:hypothetical protein AN219_01700 [Streptomyces nanshensis]|nr:hypothetical protein AN219_01700 [Streptomyces nanshensis]
MWFGRARRSDGYERQVVLVVVKSALAASISWAVAHDLMAAGAPAFAPFSAVLMMQVTIYQSMVQSLRYVVAVVAGVVLQALLAFALGPNLLAFSLMALVALALARWPKLGLQGNQVSTAAFFAFSLYVMATGTTTRFEQLGQILLLVLTGCAVGVAVNMLVFPPMRYRSAEHGIQAAGQSMTDLFDDIVSGVRQGDMGAERTGNWRHRAGELEKTVAQARASVATAHESIYYNPRRLARRRRHSGFSTYSALVEALDRITRQLVSITRSLDLWYEETTTSPYAEFLRDYADFLAAVAQVTNVLCDVGADRSPEESRDLRDRVGAAEERRAQLAEAADRRELPRGDHSRPYGVLLVEATRLTEEFQYACEVLGQHEDEGGRAG